MTSIPIMALTGGEDEVVDETANWLANSEVKFSNSEELRILMSSSAEERSRKIISSMGASEIEDIALES